MADMTRKNKMEGQYSGTIPPSDITKTWTNENQDSQLFVYDGTDWVSSHLYSATFNKRGKTNNGSFFRIGDVDCDHDKRGFIEECEIKIVKANMINQSSGAGTMKLLSDGVEIDTFAVADQRINAVASSGSVKVPKETHVSLRWYGDSIRHPVVKVYYKKVANA